MEDNRTITLRPPNWMPIVLIIAVLIGGGFFVAGKKIESADHTPTTISVSGEGKTTAVPDIAQLSFGVQVQRQATAKQAMDLLGKDMQKIFDAVKKSGVEEKDIKTEGLSLTPAYDWTDGKQVNKGFDASQSLRVKVRDMDKTSDVLAAATNAGANNVGGVSFTVDDPEKARAEARQKAIIQAQAKAKKLADQLGMKLGKLKSFSEGGGSEPRQMMVMGAAMAAKSADVAETPIPAGEQEVNVTVNLTYELR